MEWRSTFEVLSPISSPNSGGLGDMDCVSGRNLRSSFCLLDDLSLLIDRTGEVEVNK